MLILIRPRSKNREADVPIVGDLKMTAADLVEELGAAHEQYGEAISTPGGGS